MQGPDFRLELNEDSLTEIPNESFDTVQAPHILNTASDEVAALQAAILDGQDPTQAFAATAAGLPDAGANPAGNDDAESGNGGFVQVTRTGAERIAEAGFNTDVAFTDVENQDEEGLEAQNDAGVEATLDNVPRIGVISLSAEGPITEGKQITVFADVDLAPQTDLIITLNNGQIITIPAGETSGSVSFDSRPDDVYLQGDISEDFTIETTSGGSYDSLDTSASTSTTVIDDADVTSVIVSTNNVTEDNAGVTFTFTLTNPPQVGVSASVLVDVGGTIYTVDVDAAGVGSLFIATQDSDVYVDPESLTATVTDIVGGNFEATNVTGASATAQITDTIDLTTVTVTGSNVTEADGEVTFEFELSNKPDLDFAGDTVLAVQIGNQTHQVTVDAEGKGSLTVTNPNTEDAYLDASELTATVTGVTGGNYEGTDLSGASATVEIADTINNTTVTVTADNVTEADGEITFEFALSNKPDPNFAGDTVLSVKVGNQAHQVIVDAEGKGSVTVANPNTEDAYLDASELTATVTGVTGGNYEGTDLSGASATVEIADTIDNTTLTFSDLQVGSDGQASVVGTLSNKTDVAFTVTLQGGITLYFAAGNTEATSSSFSVLDENNEMTATNMIVSDAGEHNFENLVTGQVTIGLEDASAPIEVALPMADGQAGFITTLPNNGTLYIDRGDGNGAVAVTPADIAGSGLAIDSESVLTFEPTPDWSGDTQVEYELISTTGAPNETGLVQNITVLPITDVPIVSVTEGNNTNTPVTEVINISNMRDGNNDKGFTISASAQKPGKSSIAKDISYIDFDANIGAQHVNGFGVAGRVSNDGNTKEIDPYETIKVGFDKPATDIEVKFSWLAANEYAKYTIYYENGEQVTGIVKGQTDQIDPAIKISDDAKGAVTHVEFTGASKGDTYINAKGKSIKIENNNSDFVIHEITYTTPDTTIHPLVIEAAPGDVDGSEEITSIIVKVDENATMSHGTFIGTVDGVSSWSLSLEASEGYDVTIDSSGRITIEGVTVTVDSSEQLVVDVLATAQEKKGFDNDSQSASTETNTINYIVGNDVSNKFIGSDDEDVIYGVAGDDTIYGGAGDDTIYAGTGADHIFGGLGNDIIDLSGDVAGVGDGEIDIVYWAAEDYAGGDQADLITSFELGADKLDFSDFFTDTEKDDIGAYLTATGDNNKIVVHAKTEEGANLEITLDGVAHSDNILESILAQDLFHTI